MLYIQWIMDTRARYGPHRYWVFFSSGDRVTLTIKTTDGVKYCHHADYDRSTDTVTPID